jgi:CheY-like chemotaxis protein/nitrogen-specific signal transduction histidine kinase
MEVLSQTAAIAIERVEADDSLLKAKEEADAANEAKSRFLANVSHEIRTPMTGISGAVNLLLKTEVSEQQAELLGMVKSCSDVLVTVINDVLDISKIEAGELRLESKAFDPAGVVEECVALMQEPAAAAGLSLSISSSGSLPRHVLGDSVRLRQVVLNLLNNAVKFTESGSIQVRMCSESSESSSSARLKVEVEDTGIGISPSALSELFRPFRQVEEAASRRYGGSGLGLSISKQLVHLMNGEIGVESEVGKGSNFWFKVCFPLAEDNWDSSETLVLPRDKKTKPPSQVRLLLAEDNPINRRVLSLQLQQLGYQPETAGDGLEALQKIKEGRFDLVLMDCQMPHLDGYEVTRRLRAEGSSRQPVIVALTAHALEGEREKCLRAGMDGYLRKPISAEKLRRTLEELL